MNPLEKLNGLFAPPRLTRGRIIVALTTAVIADGLQVLSLPLAWALVPEIIDLVAMVVATAALGFHLLFLPTFVVEFIPLVDMLPTWTGCVLAVIALRKRFERPAERELNPPPSSNPPVPPVLPPPPE